EGKATRALGAALEHRPDMDFEGIDQLGNGKAGGWRRHCSNIFQRPVVTPTLHSPHTSSAERKTIVRVWRVTRTRAMITSPNFPGPVKSHESETVLHVGAPLTARDVWLMAMSANVMRTPPCRLPELFICFCSTSN